MSENNPKRPSSQRLQTVSLERLRDLEDSGDEDEVYLVDRDDGELDFNREFDREYEPDIEDALGDYLDSSEIHRNDVEDKDDKS